MTATLPARRRERLLEILERDGVIHLDAAADEMKVSVMTVRRDIQSLDAEGLLRRVRGGAVATVLPRAFAERVSTRAAAKANIARKAARFVPDRGTVACDASTTAGALLATVRTAQVLLATNSIDNAAVARARPGVRAILVGGELESSTGSLVGPTAEWVARSLAYDVFFSSASAIDLEMGTVEVSVEEASVKQAFAERAQRVIVLADSSKLGQRSVAQALTWSLIDTLITDLNPADERLDPYRSLVEIL